MDTIKLARKIRPFDPAYINHLLQEREQGSQEWKQEVDKKIIQTAREFLGEDYQDEILLSCPPRNLISKGEVNIGTLLFNGEKWKANIGHDELLKHKVIAGSSGSGKTNYVAHVALQLIEQDIPVVFLDMKDTARNLIRHTKKRINVFAPGNPKLPQFSFNPFLAPENTPPRAYASLLLDVMEEMFAKGDGVDSVFQLALEKCYNEGNFRPTIDEVMAYVDCIDDKQIKPGWKTTANKVLRSLKFSGLSSEESNEDTGEILQNGFNIVELRHLSKRARKFFVGGLLLNLYKRREALPEREQLKLAFIITEAHNFLREHGGGEETSLEWIVKMCREYGISVIVEDQEPNKLSSAILSNSYTKVVLGVDAKDVNCIAASCLLDKEDQKILQRLPTGHAVVRMRERWNKAFVVKIPLVIDPSEKGKISDELLCKYLSKSSDSKARKLLDRQLGGFKRIRRRASLLKPHEIAFLTDVATHRTSGVRERYRRLGWGDGTGNAVKELLLDDGWLESEVLREGQTSTLLLSLTTRAKEVLGIKDIRVSGYFESPIHRYYKSIAKEVLEEAGWEARLEVELNGGRIDVLGTKSTKTPESDLSSTESLESVGIEVVKTGISDIVEQVRRAVLEVDVLYVLATDLKVLEAVKRKLNSAGLTMPRVRVVLAWKFDEEIKRFSEENLVVVG